MGRSYNIQRHGRQRESEQPSRAELRKYSNAVRSEADHDWKLEHEARLRNEALATRAELIASGVSPNALPQFDQHSSLEDVKQAAIRMKQHTDAPNAPQPAQPNSNPGYTVSTSPGASPLDLIAPAGGVRAAAGEPVNLNQTTGGGMMRTDANARVVPAPVQLSATATKTPLDTMPAFPNGVTPEGVKHGGAGYSAIDPESGRRVAITPSFDQIMHEKTGGQWANWNPDQRRAYLQQNPATKSQGTVTDSGVSRDSRGNQWSDNSGVQVASNVSAAQAQNAQAGAIRENSALDAHFGREAPGTYDANGRPVQPGDPNAVRLVGAPVSPGRIATAPTTPEAIAKSAALTAGSPEAVSPHAPPAPLAPLAPSSVSIGNTVTGLGTPKMSSMVPIPNLTMPAPAPVGNTPSQIAAPQPPTPPFDPMKIIGVQPPGSSPVAQAITSGVKKAWNAAGNMQNPMPPMFSPEANAALTGKPAPYIGTGITNPLPEGETGANLYKGGMAPDPTPFQAAAEAAGIKNPLAPNDTGASLYKGGMRATAFAVPPNTGTKPEPISALAGLDDPLKKRLLGF